MSSRRRQVAVFLRENREIEESTVSMEFDPRAKRWCHEHFLSVKHETCGDLPVHLDASYQYQTMRNYRLTLVE